DVDGHLGEVLGEVAGGGEDAAGLGVASAGGLVVGDVDAALEAALLELGGRPGVLAEALPVEVGEAGAKGRVDHDDEPVGAVVAPAGRLLGDVEALADDGEVDGAG